MRPQVQMPRNSIKIRARQEPRWGTQKQEYPWGSLLSVTGLMSTRFSETLQREGIDLFMITSSLNMHIHICVTAHTCLQTNTEQIQQTLHWLFSNYSEWWHWALAMLRVFMNWWQQPLALSARLCSDTHLSFETQSLRDSWVSEKLASLRLWSNRGLSLLSDAHTHTQEKPFLIVYLGSPSWLDLIPLQLLIAWSDVIFVNPLEFHFWEWFSNLNLEEEENLLEILESGVMGKECKFSWLLLLISTVAVSW